MKSRFIAARPFSRPSVTPDKFDALRRKMVAVTGGRELFVFEGFGGAGPAHRLPIRIITQYAWHSLFAHQLFVHPL